MVTFLLLLIFLTLIVLASSIFLLAVFFIVIVGHLKGAPFVPSQPQKIETMIKLAGIKPGMKVVDLGSGNGAVLYGAAAEGATAVGVEINPFLWWYSRWIIKRQGLSEKIKIVWGDLRNYNLESADVVFLYLWPTTVQKLKEKLRREMKPGSRIVSNAFQIEGWRAIMEQDKVYLYINE